MKTLNQQKKWIYVFLFAAIGISSIGDFIYLVAINLTVLAKTHSAAAVSALWAIPNVASIIFRLWGGSLVDRLNKKRVLVTMDIFRGLMVLTLPFMPSITGIYIVIFLLSGADVFFQSAFGPYFTKLITEDKRKRMNSLMGMMQTGAIVVGPAIAGLLLLIGTPGFALAANGFSFLISGLVFLFLLPNIMIKEENNDQKAIPGKWAFIKTIISDWKLVFGFARKNQYFMAVYVLLLTIFVIGASLDSMEVVFADKVLGLGSSGYSSLVMVCGIGYVLGSLFVFLFSERLSIRLLISMFFITGIGFVIYAFSESFWMAGFGFMILGFFQSCGSTGFQTFFQKHIPVEIMGRFSGVFRLFQGVATVLVTVAFGMITDMIGVKETVMYGAVAQLVICFIVLVTVLLPRKDDYFKETYIQVGN